MLFADLLFKLSCHVKGCCSEHGPVLCCRQSCCRTSRDGTTALPAVNWTRMATRTIQVGVDTGVPQYEGESNSAFRDLTFLPLNFTRVFKKVAKSRIGFSLVRVFDKCLIFRFLFKPTPVFLEIFVSSASGPISPVKSGSCSQNFVVSEDGLS